MAKAHPSFRQAKGQGRRVALAQTPEYKARVQAALAKSRPEPKAKLPEGADAVFRLQAAEGKVLPFRYDGKIVRVSSAAASSNIELKKLNMESRGHIATALASGDVQLLPKADPAADAAPASDPKAKSKAAK
jgi:hypothetical protein